LLPEGSELSFNRGEILSEAALKIGVSGRLLLKLMCLLEALLTAAYAFKRLQLVLRGNLFGPLLPRKGLLSQVLALGAKRLTILMDSVELCAGSC
jgi:hypothetical protein